MNTIAITAPAHAPATPQPRLVQAAHEFEAQLMKELLKPMTDRESTDGDDSASGPGGVMADFATEALGQSLSRQGGLGIAARVLRSLSQNETDSPHSPNAGREISDLQRTSLRLSSEFENSR
ncbi:hypothetical protein P8935_16465 [Telmatobacter sp. DSM 110680]|uniref:Rod binding protein n=1 Tax=Telmatobacter sp. DSM 110680 TaxID=3036704 RepID=A0AAU7DFW0_9BACT